MSGDPGDDVAASGRAGSGADAAAGAATDDRAAANRHRALGLVLVGMSVAVWWPAFTLGAWHTLFFDQLLTVWVASTAALIVVASRPGRSRGRWWRMLALAIPSVWLIVSFLGDPGDNLAEAAAQLLAILVGILGIPFALWTLVRVVWPGLFADFRFRARFGVMSTVALIAMAAFLLGLNQNRFLTCEDFALSGNSEPPGCVHDPTP